MTASAATGLHHHHWPVAGEARGELLVVHGLSEHGGRYAGLADAANAAGYAVAAIDLPGHGRSPGPRGHIRSFEADHLAAVDELVRASERRAPDTPTFLLGHSLGGLIAARWAQRRVFAGRLYGLILLAPYVEPRLSIPAWKRGAARLLSDLWPSFSLPTGIDDEIVFRDPADRVDFAEDPLVQRRISASHWIGLERERAELVASAADLDLPTLVLVAGDDLVVSTPASLALARRLPDATVREVPDAFHALHHDPDTPEVHRELIAWTDARIARRSGR